MVDRNQQARDEFKLAQQRSQFLQALAAGQTGLFDDLHHRIEAGQYVIYSTPPNVWRWLVKSVEPDLRPNVPLGTMRAVLVCEVPLFFPAGTRLPQVLVVGDSREPEEKKEVDSSDGDNDGTPDVPRAETDPTA